MVAATHRDLQVRIAEGLFREDLYYRLNVVEINIPPLRERAGDIALLAHEFTQRFAVINGKKALRLSDEALAGLLRHPWRGNVRELENAIERAVVLSEGGEIELTPGHFPTLRALGPAAPAGSPADKSLPIPGTTLDVLEREAILRTLEAVGGSTSRAAELLDISPRKIQYKLKEYRALGVLAPEELDPKQGS